MEYSRSPAAVYCFSWDLPAGHAYGDYFHWVRLPKGVVLTDAFPHTWGSIHYRGNGWRRAETIEPHADILESKDVVESGGQSSDVHTSDQNGNGAISLTELLRVIQFLNSGGYCCVTPPATSEDGYLPGIGTNQTCAAHASDYNPENRQIGLTELLRLIQFFNSGGYYACPGLGTEDGYCPGMG